MGDLPLDQQTLTGNNLPNVTSNFDALQLLDDNPTNLMSTTYDSAGSHLQESMSNLRLLGSSSLAFGYKSENTLIGSGSQEEVVSRFQRHSVMMLESLNALRRDGVLCDVTLIAEGQRFQAHRVVLVSCSDYFRSMFTSGMKETTQREIELKCLTAKGLEKVLDIIYTSTTNIEDDDVFDIIAAANHLQVISVIDFCERNFLSGINAANVMDFISTAKLYGMRNALTEIDRYIAENLLAISKEEAFSQITYPQLLAAIRSSFCRLREIDLFCVLWQWLTTVGTIVTEDCVNGVTQAIISTPSNTNTSEEHIFTTMFVPLLQEVRYSLISPSDLVGCVQTKARVMDHSQLRDLILQALNYHVIPHRQPLMPQAHVKHLRCCKRRIVCIGGREVPTSTTVMDQQYQAPTYGFQAAAINHGRSQGNSDGIVALPVSYSSVGADTSCAIHHLSNNQTIPTKHLTTLPFAWSHGQAVVLNNFLYVLGGCTTHCSHGESATNQVWRYDSRFDTWFQCRNMLHARAYFVAAAFVDRIICVGGRCREGSLAHCEWYNPENDTWVELPSLGAPFHAHAGAVCGNHLYVSGGYSNGNFYPDLQRYDITQQTLQLQWEDLPPMLTARGWHSMCYAPLTDCLYAMGGCSLNANAQALAVLQCEQFDPRNMQWTGIRHLPHSHREAGCVVCDDVIYILGGYNTLTRSGQRHVSCYHLTTGEWSTVAAGLDKDMTGVACATLLLPAYMPHYDDY